jgi:hypothetical protein
MSLDFEYLHADKITRCAMGAAYEPKYHPDLVTFPPGIGN